MAELTATQVQYNNILGDTAAAGEALLKLDKQKQLNQEFFMKTLENIIEMSEQTNRFLIKAF